MSQPHPPSADPRESDQAMDDHNPSCPSKSAAGATLISVFGGWGISAAIHVGAIALAAAAVFATPRQDIETPPLRVNLMEPSKPEEKKDQARRFPDATFVVDPTTPPDPDPDPVVPPIQPDAFLVDPVISEPLMSSVRSRDDAISVHEIGGSGAFMAIGGGSSGGGIFGPRRSTNDKKMAIQRNGGSRGAENAVNASLIWFKRHQSPDGHWDAESYYQNCSDGTKCEPGNVPDQSDEEYDIAVTSYALLCFLGAGHDHRNSATYKTTVKRGLKWLVAQQTKGGGTLGKRNYDRAIAAMALAEAFAMTGDPELRGPAQKAIDVILAQQNQDASHGGLGWFYQGPSMQNDSSVSGWNVMALKSALAAGLRVGNSMNGAKTWLDKAWRAANTTELVKNGVAFQDAASMTVKDKSRFPYLWTTGDTQVAVSGGPSPMVQKDSKTGRELPLEGGNGIAAKVASAYGGSHSLECVGLVCGVFLGRTAGDPMVESLANTVMAHQMPTKYPCNTYSMYYNTLAIFQVGGERWKTWNASVRDMLVNSQRTSDDCFNGSWDWQGTVFHGSHTGRTLSTAYNTLCLEIYYRYAQVQKHH